MIVGTNKPIWIFTLFNPNPLQMLNKKAIVPKLWHTYSKILVILSFPEWRVGLYQQLERDT
jgi:hypothetical protein